MDYARLRLPARALYWASGLRTGFQAKLGRQRAAPLRERTGADWSEGALLAGFDRPLSRSHPALRMLGAAVDMAVRHGARVLVIVSPVPYTEHPEIGWYDRARFERRIDALRAHVEAAGGELADLHRALPGGAFRDDLGHFDATGNARLAERVRNLLRVAPVSVAPKRS